MKVTRELAGKLAKRVIAPPGAYASLPDNDSRETIRGQLDLLTYGELDGFKLDLLTDWTIAALKGGKRFRRLTRKG